MINNFDESSLILLLLVSTHLANIFICKRSYHINFNAIFSLSIIQTLSSITLFFITNDNQSYLWNIFYVDKNINLSFYLDKYSVLYLFLINLLSLILLVYLEKYLQLFDKNNIKKNILFTLHFFFSLNLLIISSNLITIILLISLNALLSNGYFNTKNKNEKFTINNSLNFIYYLQFAALFVILIILVEYFDNNSFHDKEINILNLDVKIQYVLYSLIYLSLFLVSVISFYIFYFYIKISIIDEFIIIILSLLLPSLILFTKLIFFICDFNFLPLSIKFNNFVNFFIIFNLLVLASAMVYSKFKNNLLSLLSIYSLFYLILSFFLTTGINKNFGIWLTFGYFINIISFFMMILPIYTLQNKLNNQSLQGLFYLMPKSTTLLIISLLNLIGLTPSLNLITNYQILKIFINKISIIPFLAILFFNIFVLTFLAILFKIIFARVSVDRSKDDINIINQFENDQYLVYSRIAVILLGIIFFLFRKFLII